MIYETLYFLHYIIYIIHGTVYTLCYTIYIIHSTMYIVYMVHIYTWYIYIDIDGMEDMVLIQQFYVTSSQFECPD